MALNLNNLPSFWRGTAEELNTNNANVQNGAIYFLKLDENSNVGRIAFDYNDRRIFVGSDDIHVKQTTAGYGSTAYPMVINMDGDGEHELYLTPGASLTPSGEIYLTAINSTNEKAPIQVFASLEMQGNQGITINGDKLILNYGDNKTGSVADIYNQLVTLTDNGTIESINSAINDGIKDALNTDGVIAEQINNSVLESIDTALDDDGAIAGYVNNAVVNGINTHNEESNPHENILAKKSVIYERDINCPIQSSIEIITENITGNTFTGNAFNFTKCLNYLFNNNILLPDSVFQYINIKFVYNGTAWQGYVVDSADLRGSPMTLGFYQDPSYYFSLNNLTDIGFSANEQVGTVTTDSVIYLNLYARELCGIITFDDLPGVTLTSNQEVLPGLGVTLKELTNLQTLQLQDGGQWENTLRLFTYGYYKKDVDRLPIRIIVRGD